MTPDELTLFLNGLPIGVGVCDQKYIGGFRPADTELGRVMLDHLQQLLDIQLERAKAQPVTDVMPQFLSTMKY